MLEEEIEATKRRIVELQIEHRDLDDVIGIDPVTRQRPREAPESRQQRDQIVPELRRWLTHRSPAIRAAPRN